MHFKERSRPSHILRGILWGAELLKKGLRWEVRDGRRVSFWKDAWLGDKPLLEEATSVVGLEQEGKRVADLGEQGRGWKWSEVQSLPPTKLVKLASTIIQPVTRQGDIMGWLSPRGDKFTVKTAYQLARGWEEDTVWEGWKHLWKAHTSQRVRIFMWLMSHDRLLTNMERWRRRLTGCADCARCGEMSEGVLHAIRDCNGQERFGCI